MDIPMDIPKDKSYPTESVQCHECGGWGCEVCLSSGWLTPQDHPGGKKCHREACNNPIPPNQVAVYCSDECAFADA